MADLWSGFRDSNFGFLFLEGQTMRQRKGQKKKRRQGRRKGGLRVRPPEAAVWPEECRGANWKPVYAILFAGRCQLCAYSCAPPKSRQLRDKWHGESRTLLCTNHPAGPGSLQEVLPTDTCRNFRAKAWQPVRAKAAKDFTLPRFDESDPTVRRIPLGNNLFAIVDARDYKKLSKYRWYASPHGSTIYASCRKNGRAVYMHRMIMKPRKGYIVDHIDGNGLNNRRCNLRVCTHQQNQANRGPRGGSSRFVGVYRHGDKWQAEVRYRGEYFYAGLFDDEVEAAKARDRKAYELNGEHAYINRPEDLRRWLRRKHGRAGKEKMK
jgi:hypothetical protein